MTERQLTKQLKSLRQIKPEDGWAFLAKENILGHQEARAHWYMAHRQAFMAGSLASLAVAFAVFFVWGNFNKVNTTDLVQYQALTASLNQLESNIQGVTLGLQNITKADQAIELKEAVNATISQSEKFIAEAKEKGKKIKATEPPSQEVLSALVGVESALVAMKEANLQAQKEVIERELSELEGTVLNPQQIKFFEEAEQYLNEGSYPQALEKIIEISQSR